MQNDVEWCCIWSVPSSGRLIETRQKFSLKSVHNFSRLKKYTKQKFGWYKIFKGNFEDNRKFSCPLKIPCPRHGSRLQWLCLMFLNSNRMKHIYKTPFWSSFHSSMHKLIRLTAIIIWWGYTERRIFGIVFINTSLDSQPKCELMRAETEQS